MSIPRREFEEKMADMRRNYERMTPENKQKLKACLEELSPVSGKLIECAWMRMSVVQDIDYEDEDGNPVAMKIEYDPKVLLEAVKTWDAGEDYAPSALTTWIG